MKRVMARSITDFLTALLNGATAEQVVVSTYTLDEGEVWRIAYSLGLPSDAKVVLRYDPSGFRRWGETRLVQPKWLKPFQPNPTSRRSRGRIPPIYHPKIVLAEGARKYAVVVSTANVAESDQVNAMNIHVGLVLPPREAQKIRKWILAPTPPRTLCVVVERGRPPRAEVSDNSTWSLFKKYRAKSVIEREEWQLIAPFWSTEALKLVRKGARTTAHAFFRDVHQAKTVASAVVGPWLRCVVPRRKRPFHHKVVAWRGRSAREVRVMLYIGSANLTPAGFFGIPPENGYNWEAGVLFVGGEDLWRTAHKAIRGNIDVWRNIRPKGGEPPSPPEVRPEGESDLENRLEVHLGAVIRTSKRMIRRIKLPPPADATLCNVTVELDGRERRLSLGKPVSVSPRTRRVVVYGVYQTRDRSIHRVELEVAHLTTDPEGFDLDSAVEHLRRQLRAGIDEKVTGGRRRKPKKPPGDPPNSPVTGDIRFPFRELAVKLERNRKSALAWLKQVDTTPHKLPDFWRRTARRLLEVIP